MSQVSEDDVYAPVFKELHIELETIDGQMHRKTISSRSLPFYSFIAEVLDNVNLEKEWFP